MRTRFTAVAPTSRRQQIADALREAIVLGSLKPGEQLKQDDLRREFNVSPGPIREAMRQLESEGLVVHRPNSGVFVGDLSVEELLGVILPVRVAIETYALKRSMSLLTAEDFSELERLVDVMKAGAEANDLNAVNNADLRFHERTVTASGSRHAIQLWRSVLPRIQLQVARLAPLHHLPEEIAREHLEMLEVLRSRDSRAVDAAVEEHVIGTTRRLSSSRAGREGSRQRERPARS